MTMLQVRASGATRPWRGPPTASGRAPPPPRAGRRPSPRRRSARCCSRGPPTAGGER
ncbi:unnamed protein product [Spirodela intermedia]|uniref:Uncharacterized protein n=1 Tax=Spirodela intermedia TaxID=51605 RepID=A0A7I8KNV5_SPIIN|nr:unnamed protein product [Spirodela intermedia]